MTKHPCSPFALIWTSSLAVGLVATIALAWLPAVNARRAIVHRVAAEVDWGSVFRQGVLEPAPDDVVRLVHTADGSVDASSGLRGRHATWSMTVTTWFFEVPDGNDPIEVRSYQVGFPIRAFRGYQVTGSNALRVDHRLISYQMTEREPGILPYDPILIGLITNVTFWSLVAFGAITLGQRIRARCKPNPTGPSDYDPRKGPYH